MFGKKARILVVDDDPEVVDRLTQITEGRYEVVSCTDSTEIVRLVSDERWNLLLLDVNLLIARGDRLHEILRERLGSALPPVLYYSAADEDELEGLVQKTGAQGYLTKSARGEQVLERIEQALAK